MSPDFRAHANPKGPPVREFGPCRSCGCTLDSQCLGGCKRDRYGDGRTRGLCSACIPHNVALDRFPSGSKKHDERANRLSEAQIEEMGGWMCKICERPRGVDGEVDKQGRPLFRDMELWKDPADRGAFLAMICNTRALDSRGMHGCATELGRVARGTRQGSARRLQLLAHYRDNRLDLEPLMHIQPTAKHRAEATRRQKDGVIITAVEVAALRSTVHQCQVCRRSGVKDDPDYRGTLAIDHDHDTGRWRGLLCAGCNGSMRFLDYGEPEDRQRYYDNAMWFFTQAVGVRAEPEHTTLTEINKSRRGPRPPRTPCSAASARR